MKFKKIAVIIVIFVLLCLFLFIVGKRLSHNEIQQKQDSSENVVRNEEVSVSIGKNDIVLTPTSVDINVVFESNNPNQVHIDSANYPELFEPKDKFARLHVGEISGGGSPDIKLIQIARQIPNHGGMWDNYFIVVDPEIGKVVDSGYKYLFGNIRLNSSCTSCALPTLIFREYDRQQQRYILTNDQHKKEFIDLLKQYEQMGDKEVCRINGKDFLVNEAIKIANDNDKCADFGMGISTTKPSDSFITIGAYKQIISNIKQIINGKNIEMVNTN